VNQESFSNLHIEPTQIDDILNQQSNEQLEISSCSNISIKAFKNLVTEDGIMLISKWYNEAVVPRNKLQILINDLNGFNDKCMQILKKEVLDNLKKIILMKIQLVKYQLCSMLLMIHFKI